MRKIALLCSLLLVLSVSVVLAEATPAVPVPEQPDALSLLPPEPQPLCVQCTGAQERACLTSCLNQGHLGGACGFCTLECFCF